jgi:hypothetical protein
MSLTEKAGQKNPPTTLMGKLESRIKQLEASGEDLSKMKGQTYDEFMNDITQGQRTMIRLEDEGLVRATAREIIDKDIKSKKIKLPKEIEADFKQGGGEPIDVFRQFYGEDALEQLNSMVPDFKQMYSSKEAAEAAIKKFKFKFKADRPPGSISIEDAKKAEQEFNIVPADSEEGKVITEKLIGKPKASVTELVTAEKIILDMKNMDPMDAMKEANKVLKREGKYKNLKEEDVERIMEDTNDFIFGRDIPEDPEGFAIGGRVGYSDGTKPSAEENTPSQAIINRMMAQIKQMSKMGADIDTIKTITGASDQMIKDVLGKAFGGSMSNGLDYLMGIERRGYVGGGFSSQPIDPMEAIYVDTFGFNPFPKYGFNSYMDYNTARTTGTPMNQNIGALEDYLGTLDSAREINLPGVTKDLSTEDKRAPANIVENIDTAVSSLNPYQQQRYVNYAIENPDRAIQAAQRDQDFRTAIERRDQKQKGGLSYLLGM